MVRDSLVALSRRFGHLRPQKVQDVKIVTAGFLIQNIDSAFVQWKEGPWARHLDFEDFCEYLLPYRISNEPLEYWRDMLSGKYRE